MTKPPWSLLAAKRQQRRRLPNRRNRVREKNSPNGRSQQERNPGRTTTGNRLGRLKPNARAKAGVHEKTPITGARRRGRGSQAENAGASGVVKGGSVVSANHLDALIGGLQSQLWGSSRAYKTDRGKPARWVQAEPAFQQRYANYQRPLPSDQQLANLQTQERDADWTNGASERSSVEKLPEWRDPKGQRDRIACYRPNTCWGYNRRGGRLFDHRALLVARDAAKMGYQAALKSAKGKPIRQARETGRPAEATPTRTPPTANTFCPLAKDGQHG